jgi:hypothetical protein
MGVGVGTGEGHATIDISNLWAFLSRFGVLDGHGQGVDVVF